MTWTEIYCFYPFSVSNWKHWVGFPESAHSEWDPLSLALGSHSYVLLLASFVLPCSLALQTHLNLVSHLGVSTKGSWSFWDFQVVFPILVHFNTSSLHFGLATQLSRAIVGSSNFSIYLLSLPWLSCFGHRIMFHLWSLIIHSFNLHLFKSTNVFLRAFKMPGLLLCSRCILVNKIEKFISSVEKFLYWYFLLEISVYYSVSIRLNLDENISWCISSINRKS